MRTYTVQGKQNGGKTDRWGTPHFRRALEDKHPFT